MSEEMGEQSDDRLIDRLAERGLFGGAIAFGFVLFFGLLFTAPDGMFDPYFTWAGLEFSPAVVPAVLLGIVGFALGIWTALEESAPTASQRGWKLLWYPVAGTVMGFTMGGFIMFAGFFALIAVGIIWILVGLIV